MAVRPLRIGLLVALALAFTVATGIGATTATCGLSGSTLSVAVAAGESVTIGRSGDDFAVSGPGVGDPTCGGATVTNVDAVAVTGASGAETVTVDLSGGGFGPGATAEDSGRSEIEFTVELGEGADVLVVQGGEVRDRIDLGDVGINLNHDGDADVTLAGIDGVTVNGGAGDDFLLGDGGKGTGGASPLPLTLNGDDGNDTLTGGAAADAENGGADNDTFREKAAVDGGDTLKGGEDIDRAIYRVRKMALDITLDGVANDGATGENDNVMPDVEWVIGGRGGDTIDAGLVLSVDNVFFAGPGTAADILLGRAGNDVLGAADGEEGNDSIDGGDGDADLCFADAGDSIVHCEQ